MHILTASPYLPWPLDEGGRVAQYRTFEAMRGACTFTLVVPVYSPEQDADAGSFAGMFPDVRVVAVRCFERAPPRSLRTQARRSAGKLLRRIFPAPDWPRPCGPTRTRKSPCLSIRSTALIRVSVGLEEQLARGCEIFQAEFADTLTLGPLVAGRVTSVFVHHQLHFVYARAVASQRGRQRPGALPHRENDPRGVGLPEYF